MLAAAPFLFIFLIAALNSWSSNCIVYCHYTDRFSAALFVIKLISSSHSCGSTVSFVNIACSPINQIFTSVLSTPPFLIILLVPILSLSPIDPFFYLKAIDRIFYSVTTVKKYGFSLVIKKVNPGVTGLHPSSLIF